MSKLAKIKYTFDINEYQFLRDIKRGGFGVVKLVRNKTTNEEFAAKTNLINTGLSMKRSKQIISREVGILIRVKHPTIIGFQGYSPQDFDGEQNITILMDYMKGGSLSDLLELDYSGLCPTNYDNTKRQIILIGISRGMMLLHKLHIIHRDLKAENILLDDNLYPRITDFGLSKFFDPHHSMSQSISDCGTAVYMAPEVIESDHFNTKADVYAFGILMNEILSGKRAYSNLLYGKKRMTAMKLKTEVCNGLRPEIDPSLKKGLRRIIEQCLLHNPKERPSFSEIYNKLSLSNDEYFFKFEENEFEQIIIDDDDDDEIEEFDVDVDTDDGSFLLNKKYCLDDVDINEILDYVEIIKIEPNSSIDKDNLITIKNKEIDELKQKIEELKANNVEKDKEIDELKKKINEMNIKNQDQDKNHKNLFDIVNKIDKEMKEKAKQQEELVEHINNIDLEIDEKAKQKDINDIMDKIDDIKSQNDDKNNEIEMLDKKIDKMNKKMKKKAKSEDLNEIKEQIKSINHEEIKDQIKNLQKQNKEQEEKQEEMENQINSFEDLVEDQETNNRELKKQINSIQNIVDEQKKEIDNATKIAQIVDKHSKDINNLIQCTSGFCSAEPSLDSPGILEQLKNRESYKFNPVFVASQSSNDCYNLIDPNSNSTFVSNDSGDFFIEFELENEIVINGIQIFTSLNSFPKSFDISVDEKIIKSIKEANDLNGKFKSMTINFDPISGKKVRFIQTGPNWDKDNNIIHIKRIELLSTESQYSEGVFTTLIRENERNDPHFSKIVITSSCFDLNSFFELDSKKIISTLSFKENKSWFQIELTRGFAILNGFRIKRTSTQKLKSYKIICTDNPVKNITEWTTLIDINEVTEDEHKILDIYNFKRPSPPIKVIRLILTDQNWSDGYHLKFSHLDFFGRISIEDTISESIKSCNAFYGSKFYNITTKEPNLTTPGILEQLKKKEKTKFDPFFIVSQSSNDIYNVIDPYTNGYFSIFNFIEIELEEPIEIKGIEIYSSIVSFLKSFDILIDGKTVKSIKEAKELNGKNLSTTINFDPVAGQKVRLIRTGPNWDNDEDSFLIKRIELLSTKLEYSEGVFSKLIKENERKDPHFSHVFMSSTDFDFNSIHLLNSTYLVCTNNYKDSWLQIELTKGFAILTGFRIKRTIDNKLKSYKIICACDVNQPIHEWTTLIEINEKKENEHKTLDFFKFEKPSPPTRIIRLVMTDTSWENEYLLKLYHLDFFGSISNEDTIFKLQDKCISKAGKVISVEPNLTTPGILEQLKKKEKSKLDRLFIVSLSSNDCYNVIDPKTSDCISTTSSCDYFIEFELEKAIKIKGIMIFSENSNFPKSFDISVDKKIVKSIKEANELNGQNKTMTINFDPILGTKIRFSQTGPCWDSNENFLRIKRFELLSTESKYSDGVFSTLIRENERNDPHSCRIFISCSYFDLNSIHSLNSNYNICTRNLDESWLQIELTNGLAVISGCRIKKCNDNKPKRFKIICTDDEQKPVNQWTTLININEKDENEHKNLDIYCFTRVSPPSRVIRLVLTGENWDNYSFLVIQHFDIFGTYI